MTMQYDVKSYHNTVTGVAVPYRTRLKGMVISPSATSTLNVAFANNVPETATYNIPGTTVCTVTYAGHGLAVGDRVVLNFTTGTAVPDTYTVVTVPTPSTFTVTTAVLTTSGNVTMYQDVLAEVDCATGTAFYTLVPGEGILASVGIYVFLPSATVTTTIFYGQDYIMTMQYDVESSHVTTSKTVTTSRVRLKSITVSPATASLRSSAVADPTVYKSGTYARLAASTTVTVTITAHGLTTGDRVFMDFTSGTGVDGVYAVTVTNDDVFTVTTAANTATNGNVTFYSSILLEINTYNIIGLPVLIPGEGILCQNGMFVGVGGSVTATVFYG